MKKAAAIILSSIGGWLAFPAIVSAQAEAVIQGVVVAEADHSLLPAAAVVLEGDALPEHLTATTGTDGRFRFARLTPGDYSLTVTRDGFQQQRYRLTLRPHEVQDRTLELPLRPVEEAVQVVSEAGPLPSVHSPNSTLLSPGRLLLLPLTQRTNLPDVILQAAPGMIRGHDDFVHIRGHEVALSPFINGVSFWENPHMVFSPGLGADYIESVNVMTGGFSAEYGNRFGGVLDVVTKSGFTTDNHGSVTLGGGTALRHNAALEYGGHTKRFGYYLNAAAFESARFLSPPEPNAMHDAGRGTRAFAQFDYSANDCNVLRLTLMGDGANFELPKTLLDAQLRPGFDNFQRTRSQSAILSWDHIRSADTLIHMALYQRYSRVRALPNADPYGAKLDSTRTLNTNGIKTDYSRYFRGHALKAGVDLVLLRPEEAFSYLSQPWITFTHLPDVNQDHIHFRGPNMGPGIPRPVLFRQEKTGGQASVYLQDKIRLTRGLSADVGLRFDRHSLAISDSHFSPRLNLGYAFRSGTVLYGSYNHYFVPPPVENVLAGSAGLTSLISEIAIPLPPLRPIVENQFELGVVQPVARRLRVGVTGYYRISDNAVHTVLFPDSRFYAYANFDKGKAYGMEFKAEAPMVRALGLSGYFNYALGRVWFYNPVTAGFITEAEHLSETNRFLAPMDQTHTLTSGINYHNRRLGLWTSVAFEYGSGTPGSHGGGDHEHEGEEGDHDHPPVPGGCAARCPEHFTQNLSVAWDAVRKGERPYLTLQFNIENLTNNVYLISKESTFVQGQYSIPRLFSGSLKLRF
jgi:outer membrane receptor protein involved in Fe transport